MVLFVQSLGLFVVCPETPQTDLLVILLHLTGYFASFVGRRAVMIRVIALICE